jgi:hypothetical protein
VQPGIAPGARTGIAYRETILSRFVTEDSDERTASDDHTASDRTDPAQAQHSEVEPGRPDCLPILDRAQP